MRRLAIALLCLTAWLCQAEVRSRNPVENLWYGNALYAFYQQQPFEALTMLAVQSDKNPEATPPLNALLLETALKLDYGMALSAQGLLQQTAIVQQLPHNDALWLHLANTFYHLQLFDISRQAINRITQPAKLTDHALWQYLQAQLALQQNQTETVIALLKKHRRDSDYSAYIRYNLAITQRQQSPQQALQTLDRLLADLRKPASKEQQYIQQRALISAAYISLYNDDAEAAEHYFGRLPQSSLFVDDALYGFGLAMAERQHYAAAEKLWLNVQDYPLQQMLNIKAALSLGRLYEHQQNLSSALSSFEQADSLCQQYLQQLQALYQRYDAQQLAALLMDKQTAAQQDLLQQAVFLLPLVSSESMKAQLHNLADLQHIAERLQQWQQQMPVMQAVADSRIQLAEQKKQQVVTSKAELDSSNIAEQLRQLQNTVAGIEQQKQVFALASADEQVLLEKINRIEALLPQLQDDPFIDEYQDGLRKTRGVMLWQAYQHYHARLWQVKKQLLALESALNNNRALQQQLDTMLADKQRLLHLRDNVSQQQHMISQRQQQLDTLYQRALQQLQQTFLQHIAQEQQQTRDLMRQSRLAIARVSEHFLDEGLE